MTPEPSHPFVPSLSTTLLFRSALSRTVRYATTSKSQPRILALVLPILSSSPTATPWFRARQSARYPHNGPRPELSLASPPLAQAQPQHLFLSRRDVLPHAQRVQLGPVHHPPQSAPPELRTHARSQAVSRRERSVSGTSCRLVLIIK